MDRWTSAEWSQTQPTRLSTGRFKGALYCSLLPAWILDTSQGATKVSRLCGACPVRGRKNLGESIT